MRNNYQICVDGEQIDLHDTNAFWSAYNSVQEVRSQINKLPEEYRERVLEMLHSVSQSTLEAARVMSTPLVDKEKKETIDKKGGCDYTTDLHQLQQIPNIFVK